RPPSPTIHPVLSRSVSTALPVTKFGPVTAYTSYPTGPFPPTGPQQPMMSYDPGGSWPATGVPGAGWPVSVATGPGDPPGRLGAAATLCRGLGNSIGRRPGGI